MVRLINRSEAVPFHGAHAWSGVFHCFVCTLLLGCGQPDSEDAATAMLLPSTIGEWVKQDTSITYDRESIFEYINGAGEVYRSYAFSHVLVDRYEDSAGHGVTVELFDRGNPEDAFGVFSYAREHEEDGIGAGFERKGSVLCFWQNRYFVCVAADQRDPDPGAVLAAIARGISAALPKAGDRPLLMATLPSEGRIPFSDRFFHNHQSLNYHHYLARENVLNLTPETDVALARYRPGSTYLLVVSYEDESEASAALSSFRSQIAPASAGAETVRTEGGGFLSSGQQGQFLVVVLDAISEDAADELRTAALANLTQSP